MQAVASSLDADPALRITFRIGAPEINSELRHQTAERSGSLITLNQIRRFC